MEDWKVDAGEIMDGAVETEAAPAEIEARPGEGAEGESFTLKHLDEVVSVDRGRVVELAQKGLDYDRVRSKLDSARDELAALRAQREELEAAGLAEKEGIALEQARERVRRGHEAERTGAADSPAARRRREAREFIDAYPEVAAKLAQDRSAIPDRVWERVRAGERLLAAYETEAAIADASAKGERIRELEARLAEAKQAQTNALRSTGSGAGDGGEEGPDPAALGWNAV